MSDLKYLYQKPIPQLIRELKNDAPEDYDTLGELAAVQSDWSEADNTKPDYIKNKPTIPEGALIVDATYDENNKLLTVSNTSIIYNAGLSGRPVFVKYIDSQSEVNLSTVVVFGPGGGCKAIDVVGNVCTIGD